MPHIVVLDDSAMNRMLFARLSAAVSEGIQVTAFADAAAALIAFTTCLPDLVITDYKMPGMDGARFIQELRNLPGGQDIPVIVVTAYEDREFRMRALNAGATDFLRAPVDHQEFVIRSRNLLKLGQQTKLLRQRTAALEQDLFTNESQHETAIRESITRLAQVIDTIPAVISACDEAGNRVFINRYGSDMIPEVVLRSQIGPTLNDRRVMVKGEPIQGYEEVVTDCEGKHRTLLTSKFPLFDAQGKVRNVLTTSFDITDRKQAEYDLNHLAHHDTLTGLGNRLLLMTVLRIRMAAAKPGTPGFALLFIDLDRFKSINDGFGHEHGDMLLKVVASRLLRAMRPGDVVARLGGDEFAVAQSDVTSIDQAFALAERIIQLISEPVVIQSHQTTISASVGISFAPVDAQSAEQLIKNADLAMYRAKREGRGRASFFTRDLQTSARDAVLLEIDLRQGVKDGSFRLAYQPQVDIVTGQVTGAEALLRWNRPGFGPLAPGSFLPLAEDTGLIVELDRWVLHEACRQGVAWAAAGTPIRVATNISSRTFKLDNVLNLVTTTLEKTGLDPALLEIELTETALMEHQNDIQNELRALRALGVRVAIDDFGIGYSSLAYLQLLPIDRLKIDGSFVRGVGNSAGTSTIVNAVVGIGRSLSIEVLAEGVETAEQLVQVYQAGCTNIQGFYFSKPLNADEFHAFQAWPVADAVHSGSYPAAVE